MPAPRTDMTGERYGRLLVLTWVPSHTPGPHWLCQCDCGERTIVYRTSLLKQRTLSCGCLQKEGGGYAHGTPETALRARWQGMKGRCYNKANNGYHNYGGRGIRMCEGWRSDREAFVEWGLNSGFRPSLELDRIDVDGHYSPENCRWITRLKNRRNRRITRWVNVQGEMLPMAEAAERLGLPYDTLKNRLQRGWTDEQACQPKTAPGYRIDGSACEFPVKRVRHDEIRYSFVRR